ncbi:MAG: hypothetical protein ACXWRE_02750 [Pseudobdellovibrionaceae bacterium]
MKKLLSFLLILSSVTTHAKLSDQQSMKCIDGDKLTQSVFQDLQAAYEMRIVTAKDFFQVMEKPSNCPQLRKDLKKLHSSALAALPQTKSGFRPSKTSSGSDFGENHHSFVPSPPSPPPPPPMMNEFDEDAADDFSDFR